MERFRIPAPAFLKRKRIRARAFTLIEMMVVVFIITAITAVILSGESSFNNSILLSNAAYSVATSIRNSESLGLSSQAFSGVNNAGYGIDFNQGTPTSYILYADIQNPNLATHTSGWCPTGTAGMPDAKPGDCTYNGSTERVQQINFTQGVTITDICAYTGSHSLYGCAHSNGNSLQELDIEFVRPSTDAVITGMAGSGAFQQADLACIKLSSPGGANEYVEVNQLGEISVVSSCP